MDLVLLKRKGFVKIALATGAGLVPVIGFGENELFNRLAHPMLEPIHWFFNLAMKSSAPVFSGRWGTFIPERHPLVTVFGKPIDVLQKLNATDEEIDALHSLYVESLRKLYDDYKDIFHSYRTKDLCFVK